MIEIVAVHTATGRITSFFFAHSLADVKAIWRELFYSSWDQDEYRVHPLNEAENPLRFRRARGRWSQVA
jgi:hypothetical protein